jgi:CO dehydrogenase/acetyl-CoA synthase gamma subunit (corrinoid Fe-S protein)
MITADLYLNKIEFLKYLPGTDCEECGEPSCAVFVKQLKSGTQSPSQCPFLNDNQINAFQIALQADRILPKVPALDLPRPAASGLMEINRANESGLVLVSGNSEFTQEILTSIMAFTLSPFWLLLVDCRGDTVDMAMVYESLKPEKIFASLEGTPLHQGRARRELVLPGFASRLKEPLERQTGWQIRVGPICIAELPLFLGDNWEVPSDVNLG